MSYEGEHKVIPIRGIERAGEDNMIEDGATNEIIGMEYKDGSYKPYVPTIMPYAKYPQGTKKIYVHKTSFQENVIIIVDEQDESRVMWIKKDDFDNGTYVDDDPQNTTFGFEEITDLIGTNEMVFVGNALYASTNEKNLYAIFLQEQDYKVIADISNLPKVKLSVSRGYYSINEEESDEIEGFHSIDKQDNISYRREYLSSFLTKIKTETTSRGGVTGVIMACYCWRLNNGDLIQASNPILLREPNALYENNFISTEVSTDNEIESKYFPTNKILNQDGTFCLVSENLCYRDTNNRRKINNSLVYYLSTDKRRVGAINPLYILDKDKEYGNCSFFLPFKNGLDSETKNILVAKSHRLFCTKYINAFPDKNFGIIDSYCVSNKLQYTIIHNSSIIQDEINSLCVFISPEISIYKDVNDYAKINSTIYEQAESGSYYAVATCYPIPRKNEEILRDIKDIKLLYKVAEIPVEELKFNELTNIDLKGKLGDNLLVQETLPISAIYRDETESGSLFSYNERVHIYNYNRKLFNGYTIQDFFYVGGKGQIQLLKSKYDFTGEIIVYLKENHIERKLISKFDVKGGELMLYPIIAYPSSSAYKIEIFVKRYDGIGKCSFSLYQNKNLNIAYYIKQDLTPITIADFERIDNYKETDGTNEIIPQKNGIKVSEAGLPYSYDLASTYRIGYGEIIGMAKLSISLSQDTFGRYPVLVFCTDGIYSMGVNAEGTGAYTTITPFSREVCVNKNTICEIDGAVMFATDKGLMVATQQGVQEFCPKLNGMPHNLPQNDKEYGSGMKVYWNAISHKNLVQLENDVTTQVVISTDDFIDYLQDADTFVSYVSKKNKVIVYNGNKQYVYWIDIPSRHVTKLNMRISFDNNNYPTEEYYDYGKSAYQFAYRSAESVNSNCLLQTRPIKINSQLKSSYRVVVRGFYNSILNSEQDKNYAGLYVMGSLDGNHWQVIGYKEKQLSKDGFHDLGCITERVSMKYLMIVFVGKFAANTHIDHIELTTDNKYNNKLK